MNLGSVITAYYLSEHGAVIEIDIPTDMIPYTVKYDFMGQMWVQIASVLYPARDELHKYELLDIQVVRE